jgi:hypothetical protein
MTEIDQAVQAATSFSEFGDTLTTRLASILGLVYGALYIADADGTELQRVGGMAVTTPSISVLLQ